MEDERRIESLLEEIMDSGRSPEDVCRACPELLPAVREQLRRLRAFEGEVEAMFPTSGFDGTAPEAEAPDIPGYVVLNELGRGGIGVVYRARDLRLDREVAVKLLQGRHHSDSPIARRFVDEAHITAQLQHPGIPPVHELGTLPSGRPFLAMKLIKGSTLDQLLADRSNPSDDRGRFVATFEQVCQAVGYAHAHRVIHRDLKPSNVMVGAFGEVQVMDWGLAKVLTEPGRAPQVPESARDAAASTAIRLARDTNEGTLPCDLLGTPAFMSPEQAIGAVDRIDTRSDVYNLGGILCAVLTGKPPFVAGSSEATRQLAAHARLEDAHARLAACGAEPGLVALCLRCLAPEPDNRPRDAGEVAAAVAALRSAAEERAQQAELERVRATEHGKRRRVLLAAIVAIVVVLLAGLSVSLWQTHRAEQERDDKVKALAAEQRARELTMAALRDLTDDVVENQLARDTQLTEENKEFLRNMIKHYESFAALTANDAASRAIRAEGHSRVGRMRHRLGDLGDAETAYSTALGLQKQLAADFPARPEFRRDLASSHNNLAILLEATGRLKEAEAAYGAALELRRQLAVEIPNRPEFRRELAVSQDNLGLLLRDTGRLKEAEANFDSALTLQRQLAADFPTRPEFRSDLASSHNYLGLVFRDTDRPEKAEAAYRASVSIREQLAADFPARPEFRRELAKSHNSLGVLLCSADRLVEAKADFDAALHLQKQLAADFPTRPEFRHDLAGSYNNLGILFRSTHRRKESEEAYGAAMNLLKGLTADFPNQADLSNELAGACVNLANLCNDREDFRAAKTYLEEAQPHHRAALKANPRNPMYRQFLRNNLWASACANAGLLDRESAVQAAETIRDLGWDPPGNAYDAACALAQCASIAAKHKHLDVAQREEAARFYGDAAMKLLRDAVSKGCRDVASMKEDTDLDPLRQRDDFRDLVAELEGKGK